MKNILAIIGSASRNSSNLHLIQYIEQKTKKIFQFTIYDQLSTLPHFSPELSIENTPQEIKQLRSLINTADGVIISTPEYIFSIPSGLKNILEWCASTTIFKDKPVGLITAASNGEKAYEEIWLIMQTLMAQLHPNTCILIKGIAGKMDKNHFHIETDTENKIVSFIEAYNNMLDRKLTNE